MKRPEDRLPWFRQPLSNSHDYLSGGLRRDDFSHGINLARSGGGDIDEVYLSLGSFLEPIVCPLRGSFKSPVGHDGEIQLENSR